MANKENLISLADRTTEEKREIAIKGGKASGEVRREKATFKKTLEMLLEEKNSKGKSYRDMIVLGQIKSAIDGKAENFKLIMQVLGELQEQEEKETPSININIVNNEELEKAMYESDN